MGFRDRRRRLRIWLPPLVGIPAMLLLGYRFEVAQYFLFAHHLFWVVGIILLINPVAETFWPSAAPARRDRPKPRPSARARLRRHARQHPTQSKAAPETPVERLARLRGQKEGVEHQIEELTAHQHQSKE